MGARRGGRIAATGLAMALAVACGGGLDASDRATGPTPAAGASVTRAPATAGPSGAGPSSTEPSKAATASDRPRTDGRQRRPPPELDAWLGYQLAGGIDGRLERLVVDRDGMARLSLGRPATTVSAQLDEDTMQALRAAISSARFDTGSSPGQGDVGRLPSAAGHPDQLMTTVVHDGLVSSSSDGDVPPSLQPLVELLRELVDAHRPA